MVVKVKRRTVLGGDTRQCPSMSSKAVGLACQDTADFSTSRVDCILSFKTMAGVTQSWPAPTALRAFFLIPTTQLCLISSKSDLPSNWWSRPSICTYLILMHSSFLTESRFRSWDQDGWIRRVSVHMVEFCVNYFSSAQECFITAMESFPILQRAPRSGHGVECNNPKIIGVLFFNSWKINNDSTKS